MYRFTQQTKQRRTGGGRKNRIRQMLSLFLFAYACMFQSLQIQAQTFPPPTSCTSKDLELISATLPSPTTNPCQCDGTRTLVLGVRNKTGSTRTSFALWGTLRRYNVAGVVIGESPIFACANQIKANSDNFLPATSGQTQITVNCGESLEIVNLYLAWTTANSNETCDFLARNTATINPKCGILPSIKIGLGVTADFATTNATCTGNGSLQVFPSGGVAPYQVNINGTVKTVSATGGSTTFSLPSGTYSVTVTDSRGCPKIFERTIGSSAAPDVTGIGGAFTKTCTTNSNGATIGETPVSGFTYAWAPTTGLSNAAIGNPTANPGTTTTYTVTKTNTTTGCSSTKQVTVTVDQALPIVTGIGGDFTKTCISNASGATIGEIPASGFTYSWAPATGLSNTTIGSPLANPGTTTTYTVTKTNTTNGCFTTKDVTITVNTTTPNTSGIGGAFTKTCTTNTSGAAIGETAQTGFSYAWTSVPAGFTSTSANPTVNPTVTTTYTVRKTNTTNGCFADAPVTITVNTTTPDVTGIGGAFTKTCINNTGGATIGETPVSGFTYTWMPATGLSNAAIGNPTANPDATTTYTVTKTNTANGCFSTKQVTVTVNTEAPTFTVCIIQPTLCANSGSVTFNASGGSGLEYSIDNGANFYTSNSFTNLASGSVSGFRVKNAHGCVTEASCADAVVSCAQPASLSSLQSNVTSQKIVLSTDSETTVTAAPNPFRETIRFELESAVSGKGSLELYNLYGQKVQTIFQGHVQQGKMQTVTFQVPAHLKTALVYVFRVGNLQVTGKLIGLK